MISKLIERDNEFTISSNYKYFIDNCEKLTAADYVISENDALMCRTKTNGVVESTFVFKKSQFMVVDVGGQRSERKKWIHAFENVNCLIFFASLSEYDQKLEEDPRVNRMHESCRLFQEVSGSKWFENVAITLILNKRDLFAEKIKVRDLRCAFPEYTDGTNYEAALKFIRARFLSCDKNENRKIYVHVACATDIDCIKEVFAALADHTLSLAMHTAL